MSLRNRLLSAIFLALLISFSLGTSVAVWQAGRSVGAEQAAALVNARQGALAALASLPEGDAGEVSLRRIVGAFDGSRHLRAALLGADGAVLAVSAPAPAPPTPSWLLRLIAPSIKPLTLQVRAGDARALRLESAPFNEAAERWSELRERIAEFAFFFVLAAGLCSVTATRSLRPLTELAEGMVQVGRGETAPALPETGPVETAALARTFNGMAVTLRAAQVQNRQLARQLVTIAEEERAEIARDLHDEIGPVLFAITTFAAAIGRQVETGDLGKVPAQLDSIQRAVARLQSEVRDMLGRLREGDAAPQDLAVALGELVAFWRTVRPETRFDLALSVPESSLNEARRECLFRVAQEAVSNAVRHGNPASVAIEAFLQDGAVMLRVTDDGAGGAEGAGSGLAGMRARTAALGGHLVIERGAGWRVAAALPLAADAMAPGGLAQAGGA
jgi:two-component system sensor histidine kinase UhpB